jgi:hypothetical protein
LLDGLDRVDVPSDEKLPATQKESIDGLISSFR